VIETERTLLIADLSGYTALTETHGAMHASEIVLRFDQMAEASLEPGVVIVDRVGDQVLCAGVDTHAVLRSALRLCAVVEREPGFLAVQAGMHRGPVVERSGRLFGAPVNLTARLAAQASGGQILCTEAIAAAAREHPGVEARFVGERRFKNVTAAVIVYELMRVSQPAQPSAVDPVCRMQIEPLEAAASVSHLGMTYHFCSHECARLFREAPESYARLRG
jgi:class 3 adenylate cyclase/YHS domain-containing protein